MVVSRYCETLQGRMRLNRLRKLVPQVRKEEQKPQGKGGATREHGKREGCKTRKKAETTDLSAM